MAIDVTQERAEARELDEQRNIALGRIDFARYIELTEQMLELLADSPQFVRDLRMEKHVAQTRLVMCRTYAESWYAQRWTGFDDETPITSERLKGLGFVETEDGLEHGRIVFDGHWWDSKDDRIRQIHPEPRTLGEVRLLIRRFSDGHFVGLEEPSDWVQP